MPNYGQVRYKNIYEGIDLIVYSKGNELEYDFVVAAGADPAVVQLRIDGADGLQLDRDGELVITAGNEQLRQHRPIIYQAIDNEKKIVTGRFRLSGQQVGFEVGQYDKCAPLVIDPAIVYSTYFGGGNTETVGDIAIDAAGNVYITGRTTSTNFPVMGAVQSVSGGGGDTFVIKLNSAGRRLFSTFLGGSGEESSFPPLVGAIAVDSASNVFICGETTSRNFPVTGNAFQSTFGEPGNDGFATKLSTDGNALIFSTYIGGNGPDGTSAVGVDASDNLYVLGGTASTNFPTRNSFQPAMRGGGDSFVVKFTPTGSLIYSTLIGGRSGETSFGLTVDVMGNAYITGITASSDFPTVNPIQAANGGGGGDTFIVKIDPSGSRLLFSTYLGGSGSENSSFGTSLDADGNIYVTGGTTSTNFPVINAQQQSNAGGTDLFITKLSPISSLVPTLRVNITFDPLPPGQILPPQNDRVDAVQAMLMSQTDNSGGNTELANIVKVADTIIDQIPQLTAFNVFRVPAPADGSIPTADQITGNPNNLVAMLPANANAFTDFVATTMNQNFFYSITSSFGNGMQSSGSPPIGTNLPVVRNPLLVKGALLIDSSGSFILSGATLIVNDVQTYPLMLDAGAMKFVVAKKTTSMPGGLKIKKLIKKGATVKLMVRNPDGKSSLSVMFTRTQ